MTSNEWYGKKIQEIIDKDNRCMKRAELLEYLSKKYELDYIKGPITGASYLCFKDWSLLTDLDCAEGVVRIYDEERCICDLIKDKKSIDLQIFTGALKAYFGHRCNPRKIIKYAKALNVEDKVRMYMEVLQ